MNTPTLILIILLVIVSCLFGLMKMPTVMTIAVGAISIALFFANIDKFSVFKGGGIEARLRDAVSDANAAIEDLRELALVFAQPEISDLSNLDFKDKPEIDERFRRVEAIATQLHALEVPDKRVDELCAPFFDGVERHLKSKIFWDAFLNKSGAKALVKFQESGTNWQKLNAEKMRKIMLSFEIDITPHLQSRLENLEYFEQTKSLLSIDGWR